MLGTARSATLPDGWPSAFKSTPGQVTCSLHPSVSTSRPTIEPEGTDGMSQFTVGMHS